MHTQVLAVLAKYNKQRGVITWTFEHNDVTNEYFAVRNDGRVIEHPTVEDMRLGFLKLRDEYKFTRLA